MYKIWQQEAEIKHCPQISIRERLSYIKKKPAGASAVTSNSPSWYAAKPGDSFCICFSLRWKIWNWLMEEIKQILLLNRGNGLVHVYIKS